MNIVKARVDLLFFILSELDIVFNVTSKMHNIYIFYIYNLCVCSFVPDTHKARKVTRVRWHIILYLRYA